MGTGDGRHSLRAIRPSTVVAVIAVILLLHLGAPFFIPLFLAVMISYALSPLVDLLTRALRYRVISAAVVVIGLLAAFGAAAWSWSDDVQAIWARVPHAAQKVSRSLQRQIAQGPSPINEVKKAAADLESVAQTGKPAPAGGNHAQPVPSTVSVWQVAYAGWKTASVAAIELVVVLFLVFFMLASGNLFKKKLVMLSGERLAQRKFTVQVIDEIDAHIRRYLMVVLVSNVLVGLGTWAVFRIAGLEYAGLWGLVAGVLHTIPYFGPALIAAGSLVVAFLQFEDWTHALIAAGSSVAVATVVGSLFATWLASRQTRMNATASFIGLLFFGWIWGLWGLLLGIPLLAIVKTVCEHNEDWKPVGELLAQ